jgi:hypothetical protein
VQTPCVGSPPAGDRSPAGFLRGTFGDPPRVFPAAGAKKPPGFPGGENIKSCSNYGAYVIVRVFAMFVIVIVTLCV